MAGVSKIYPPQKQVLKNIYLSFFYGAKIGVLGLNGSGKSIAAENHCRRRQAVSGRSGVVAGLLGGLPGAGAPARPHQNGARSSGRRRRRNCGPAQGIRRNQRSLRSRRRRLRQAARAPGQSAGAPRPARRLEPGQQAGARHGRPAHPRTATPSSATSRAAKSAAWPCAACCCKSPTCCCSTSPPTTSTPKACCGWSSTCSSTKAP